MPLADWLAPCPDPITIPWCFANLLQCETPLYDRHTYIAVGSNMGNTVANMVGTQEFSREIGQGTSNKNLRQSALNPKPGWLKCWRWRSSVSE
jgi:hypothetical protein